MNARYENGLGRELWIDIDAHRAIGRKGLQALFDLSVKSRATKAA